MLSCLCCRRKVPKNDLLGLEGMVKIKNPDDLINTKTSPTTSTNDHSEQRASTTHRSLPDIPVIDAIDTNSDLYATVGEKVVQQQQATESVGVILKQISGSQHSSLSQADDINSPYASVRSNHAYDKIRKAEHPYAQLQPIIATATIDEATHSRRASNESLLATPPSEIPAASNLDAGSCVAGRISASQELPYMTPPIVQPSLVQQPQIVPQHFSGDSQDSSKGYTSISVREPLANIMAQTKRSAQRKTRELISDSHYATVSDDSDEMYAAIEDNPNNNQVDLLYTSGSETYAQIQPIVINVELNCNSVPRPHLSPVVNRMSAEVFPPAIISQLITSQHSRQASSSSSIGNLGSPKPEKRQANSPLPPTPKQGKQPINSSRNSMNSSMDLNSNVKTSETEENTAESAPAVGAKKKSPSKDLEGMYAKVMKKNKLSHISSENSPVLSRQVSPESQQLILSSINTGDNNYETIERKKVDRRNSYEKDPGYETIPGEKCKNDLADSGNNFDHPKIRTTATGGVLAGIHKVSQNSLHIMQGMDSLINKTVTGEGNQPLSLTSDPDYEVLIPKKRSEDEDGYSKVLPTHDYSADDSIKNEREKEEAETDPGYSRINERGDGYASIDESRKRDSLKSKIPLLVKDPTNTHMDEINDYHQLSEIAATSLSPVSTNNYNPGVQSRDHSPGYSSVSELQTTSESSKSEKFYEDPNYESIKHFDTLENPYDELLEEEASPIELRIEEEKQLEGHEKRGCPEISLESTNDVGDYFQV